MRLVQASAADSITPRADRQTLTYFQGLPFQLNHDLTGAIGEVGALASPSARRLFCQAHLEE